MGAPLDRSPPVGWQGADQDARQDGAKSIKVRAADRAWPGSPVPGLEFLRCERNKGCRAASLGRDCRIEVSEMGHASLVEQDVRGGDVSVNHATPMYASKCPASAAGLCGRSRREAPVSLGLKISAVITESPAGQILEHQVRTGRIKVKVVQRDDGIV